jgi:outer membrane protein OmpA-like peptidoglycan-associated protein
VVEVQPKPNDTKIVGMWHCDESIVAETHTDSPRPRRFSTIQDRCEPQLYGFKSMPFGLKRAEPLGANNLISMSVTRKSLWLGSLAVVLFFAFAVFTWVNLRSQSREIAAMRVHSERMMNRLDLLTEIVEAASTRAARAEENALAAAEARTRAERESAEARSEARLSAEQARAALAEAEKIRQEREQDLNRLQEALGALVETRRTALGLVMSLGDEAIQFDFDQAAIRPENRELLSRIAGILLTAKGYSVYVYGHTDDVGSDEYNRGLSERRARSVHDYLIEAGLDPGTITTRGYGKSSPRAPGTSAEARAKNRRVEIGIVDVSFDIKGEVRRN